MISKVPFMSIFFNHNAMFLKQGLNERVSVFLKYINWLK